MAIAVSLIGLTVVVRADAQSAFAVEPSLSSESAETSSINSLIPYTRAITVKVIIGDNLWGSGVLIQRQGQIYTVVTNRHVLAFGSTYKIQTVDGNIYPATVADQYFFEGSDLVALTFESPTHLYAIAVLGRSSQLQVGDPVFASGFPLQGSAPEPTGLKITGGRISLMSQKTFEEGYRIGYTNAIQKGMSGGPVLNDSGELVALNGVHAFPLWGNPYVFQDGSSPCPALYDLMMRSSWGIPIEDVLQGMSLLPVEPHSDDLVVETLSFYVASSLLSILGFELNSSSESTLPVVVQQMQQRAIAAQQCQPMPSMPGESASE